MRRLFIALFLTVSLLVAVGPAFAQDGDTPLTPQQILEQVEALAESADQSADAAQDATELAFNLLGIFEAVSVAITIVAAAAGLFGLGQLNTAQSSLTKAREEVEQEILEIREQFESDLDKRREEFETLSDRLMEIVEKQRRDAANSTLATALLSFGERQYRAADFVGAVNTYRRALELDANNPVTHYRLGYVYNAQGELEDAEKHYKLSLDIDAKFAPSIVALGYVYRRMGQNMEGIDREQLLNLAEQQMLKGLKMSPKLVDEDGESWWGALGGLYRRRGQIAQAIFAYEQATSVTPHSSYPFSNLATLYGDENNVEGMLAMFKRVEKLAFAEVQADVDNYWGYFDLLTAQLANGHIQQAEDILPSVLETVPPDAAYAFDSLKDTLNRVADVLHDRPQARHIRDFIQRIDTYVERRGQAPAALLNLRRPEDTTEINVDGSSVDAVAAMAQAPEDAVEQMDTDTDEAEAPEETPVPAEEEDD